MDTDAAGLLLDGRTVDARVRGALTGATLLRTVDGASTLTLTLHDKDRSLIRARLTAYAFTASLDDIVFERVQVRKSGSFLTVVFEDATVSDLRKLKGRLAVAAGTTTLDAFARRLLPGGVRLVAEPGQRNLAPLMRGTQDNALESSHETLTRLADERAWRYFVDKGVVYLGSDGWLLKRVPAVAVREHTNGVEDVDWDADAGKRAPEASFTVQASRWQTSPGVPIMVHDQGLGSGLWLVQSIERGVFSPSTTVTLVREQPELPEPKPEPRDDGGPTTAAAAGSGGAVAAGPVSAKGYSWPVSGTIASGYGSRGGKLHAGVDIPVKVGTSVRAAKDGVVTFAGEVSGYGIAVYLQHDDAVTRYGHLSAVKVRRGRRVARGDVIALSGNTGNSTGPHLHFEVRPGDRAVNPLPYLPTRR